MSKDHKENSQEILKDSKRLLALYVESQKRQELLENLPQGHGSGLDADTVDNLHALEIIAKGRSGGGGGGAGAGTGDMTKAVYDINENGIVDNSEKLDGKSLAQVQDHIPKAHTHPVSELMDHDKPAHDILGIDASTLEGFTKAQVQNHAPQTHANEAHDPDMATGLDLSNHTANEDAHHTKFTTVEHDVTERHPLGTVVPHDALASLTERSHNSLTNVTTDQHHPQLHGPAHQTEGADKVHFSELEHSPSDKTLHDALTSTPHISESEKGQLHDRLHPLDSSLDHSGEITDSQHGSRGIGLHGDSHGRQHDHSLVADGSPIAEAGVPDLPASKITSGRFPMARVPDGTLNYVMKGAGAGADPGYGQVGHGELTGVATDQHHARDHNLLSGVHLDTLVDGVAAGDIIIGNATPKWARLPKGADGLYLKLVSGLPGWASPPAAPDHNLLSSIHPDTLVDNPVAGDIIIANSTPKWARLAKGTDGKLLKLVSGVPAWVDVAPLSDVQSATADLSATTGSWQDLLTVSRTTTETRVVQINGGYTALCGSSAGTWQVRIMVDAVAVAETVRTQYTAKSVDLHVNTFHLVQLAAGSHTIKLQYYTGVAGTIKARMLAITWDV